MYPLTWKLILIVMYSTGVSKVGLQLVVCMENDMWVLIIIRQE